MKLKLLGYGGAFDPALGSSSALVDTGKGTCTLVDCGCSTFGTLIQNGLVDRVTAVLITHMHDDHVGSLGSLLNFARHVSNRTIDLLTPPRLVEPLTQLLSLQHTRGPISEKVCLRTLEDPDPDGPVIGDTAVGWIDTFGMHQANMPTYAYVFRRAGECMAWSGDLANPDIVFDELARRCHGDAVVFHDTCFSEKQSGSHTYYKRLEPHLKQWRIFGYHNNPANRPADCSIPLACEQQEFRSDF